MAQRRRVERDGRRRSGGEALRQGVQRIRRRLGGAARRRAYRVRVRLERADQAARMGPPDGLPRAVDPLRAVHRPPARPLALPRPGRDRRHGALRRSIRAHDGRRVRVLRQVDRADAGALRARAIRRARPIRTPSTVPRSGPRRSIRCAGCCPPRRSRTSGSTAPARRSKRCCCACAPARSQRRGNAPARC